MKRTVFCAIKTGDIESWKKKTKENKKNEWVEEKKRLLERMKKWGKKTIWVKKEWMKGGLSKN